MKNNIRKTGMCLTAMLSLAACGTYSTSSVQRPSDNGATSKIALAPKFAGNVIITENNITDRTYVSLGDVSVTVRKMTIFDSDPTREKVAQALREKAAEIGADAVVLVRYGTVGVGLFSWGEMEGQGRAVAFHK